MEGEKALEQFSPEKIIQNPSSELCCFSAATYYSISWYQRLLHTICCKDLLSVTVCYERKILLLTPLRCCRHRIMRELEVPRGKGNCKYTPSTVLCTMKEWLL